MRIGVNNTLMIISNHHAIIQCLLTTIITVILCTCTKIVQGRVHHGIGKSGISLHASHVAQREILDNLLNTINKRFTYTKFHATKLKVNTSQCTSKMKLNTITSNNYVLNQPPFQKHYLIIKLKFKN